VLKGRDWQRGFSEQAITVCCNALLTRTSLESPFRSSIFSSLLPDGLDTAGDTCGSESSLGRFDILDLCVGMVVNFVMNDKLRL